MKYIEIIELISVTKNIKKLTIFSTFSDTLFDTGNFFYRVRALASTTYRRKTFCAGVAELVDALVLGTSGLGRGGSSPFTRTKIRAIIKVEFIA